MIERGNYLFIIIYAKYNKRKLNIENNKENKENKENYKYK